MSSTTKQRLLDNIIITEAGCWEYSRCRDSRGGYGRIFHGCTTIMAHRASWMIHKGPIPDGLFVLHICDNPPCVNPEHLFLGTAADNTDDMITKGRKPVVKNPKLSVEQALDIKLSLFSRTLTRRQLSIKHNISIGAIDCINHGRSWRDLDMALYNCKQDGEEYRISKFDNDLNVEASYLTNGSNCDCPAGHRPVCRHRIMLPRFIAKNATAGQWFHNYEANQWIRAASDDEPDTLGDLASAASELTIAASVSFPDDVSGDDLADAFATLIHQPKPINLLELAKPTLDVRFSAPPTPAHPALVTKPLRRL